jgi:hypothetical protein
MRPVADSERETIARYRALESGAWVTATIPLLTAAVASWLYRPSALFALGCCVGGVFVFLGWRAGARGSVSLSGIYSLLGVAAMVGALLLEIERPFHVLVASGFSIMGAVMFGLISIARRASLAPRA